MAPRQNKLNLIIDLIIYIIDTTRKTTVPLLTFHLMNLRVICKLGQVMISACAMYTQAVCVKQLEPPFREVTINEAEHGDRVFLV